MAIRNDKIQVIQKKHNSISLSWKNLYQELNLPPGTIYKLQIFQDEFLIWKNLYWGFKTSFTVTKLTSFTCYLFRIRHETKSVKAEWITFKELTEDAPYGARTLSIAIRFKRNNQVRKIIGECPYLLEIENKERLVPLMQVIRRENYQIASILIKLGADLDHCFEITKISPLMSAIFNGHLDLAALLIKKGADVNLEDINGRLILHHAVDSGKVENVLFALQYTNQSNINRQDNQGWTPLLRAGTKKDIINLLISRGADLTLKDKNGFDYEKHCELLKKPDGKPPEVNPPKRYRFRAHEEHKRQTIFPKLLTILDRDIL